MSLLVLTTGHEIAVEQRPAEAHSNIADLLEHGHGWAFSELTGAWFRLGDVVAVLPDPTVKPRKRSANGAKA